MEENDTIDLRKIFELIKIYKIRLLAIILITTLLALVIAFVLPKQYESTTVIRAKNNKQGSGISMQAAAAVALLGGGNASPTQNYIEMLKSRTVLEPIIAKLDLPEEKKEKMDSKSFSKSYLKIQNTKGTDLIELTATGRTPEEAQMIASDVISSFQQLLTNMNQSEQSLMMKFLKDRLTIAKKDMEAAEQNLEKFRQQEKIYVPDEQAKAVIKKLSDYDQIIAKLQVETETNQAKLQGVNDQLEKQNVAISTYNIVDNKGIQQIRDTIIQKEMALVEQQQRYTDKHPNIVLLNREIEELQAKLKDEVEQSVAAGTNTLNPIHAGLLKDKVATETELLAGQAAIGVAKKIQAENEQEISKLSAGSVTYIGLERQVRITQEVYGVLVKNYEQTRIQEAMESMDIQVVDQADLPKRPSAPKKLLITAIGGVLGVMFSFAYLFVLYNQHMRRQDRLSI